MKNVTLSLDEHLLKTGRVYAERRNTSLNNLVRESLSNLVSEEPAGWVDDCFALMDKSGACHKGKKWTREELYER